MQLPVKINSLSEDRGISSQQYPNGGERYERYYTSAGGDVHVPWGRASRLAIFTWFFKKSGLAPFQEIWPRFKWFAEKFYLGLAPFLASFQIGWL